MLVDQLGENDRVAMVVYAGAAGLALGLAAGCGGEVAEPHPALFEAAPEAARRALEQADKHILVVRHARKISEDCNALDCPLSAEGEAMVARLETLLGAPTDAAFASSACRTVRTAEAGGTPVIQHQPGPGHDARCGGGEPVTRLRQQAIEEARFSDAQWTLVAEHSNTVCLWLEAFAPGAEPLCGGDGGVSGRYGDVYWLYWSDGAWALTRLDGAFDLDAAGAAG